MQLSIGELLDYTEEERDKWHKWFSANGDAPLRITLANETHPTVGALILHCFWAELFYALWMRGEILSESSPVVIENKNLPSDQASRVFAFGQTARKAMRDFTESATGDDWGRIHEVDLRGFQIRGTARKLIAHILVHEIRHWAQVAILMREHGLSPPGDHDLLFSHSFGVLAKRT